MKNKEPSPPRWAQAMLRSLLRPSNRESISGDLLEEYRLARRRLVQAPGVSLPHALIYLWAGYHSSKRTRLIWTGMLVAGVTSFVGFTTFLAAAAIRAPDLILAPFSKPFIVVILSALLLVSLSYGVLLGVVGGVIGRRAATTAPREVRAW